MSGVYHQEVTSINRFHRDILQPSPRGLHQSTDFSKAYYDHLGEVYINQQTSPSQSSVYNFNDRKTQSQIEESSYYSHGDEGEWSLSTAQQIAKNWRRLVWTGVEWCADCCGLMCRIDLWIGMWISYCGADCGADCGTDCDADCSAIYGGEEILETLISEVFRADEGDVSGYGASPEIRGGGNGRSPRKPVDQRHRPGPFPLAKIRYGIHRNTLTFKLHESEFSSPPRKTGGQAALSPEEEKLLPMLKKKKNSTDVLIGDNLSSHLNCRDNDIRFVALPIHPTHLLQPLDVAFFRPMKGAWRSLLTNWKEIDEGRRITTVPKMIFPRLLNDLIQELAERQIHNLKAGFKACGIYPLNMNGVLKKLCDSMFKSSGDHIENESQAFLVELHAKRDEMGPKKVTRSKLKHRKRQEIPSSSDEEEIEIVYAESDDSLGSVLNYNESDTGNSKKNNDPPCDVLSNDPTDGVRFNEAQTTILSQNGSKNTPSLSAPNASKFKQGDYVAVQHKGKTYPGKMVTHFDPAGDACISAMAKKGKIWIWPNPADKICYKKEQVLRKIFNTLFGFLTGSGDSCPRIISHGYMTSPGLHKHAAVEKPLDTNTTYDRIAVYQPASLRRPPSCGCHARQKFAMFRKQLKWRNGENQDSVTDATRRQKLALV
ncbi:hypothetical protein PR048_002607 [Dryococelus australis]|uniref:DDE-1 domain-containing protein n=1 Tax=Dryococelus australis TaxID=614101 RepID=A0ABQ9ILQ6_9NEOP|nr:hypothetical protein PR048_002607 [Dryococelus australis]